MIIERIKRHNTVNGFMFSFVEFALITLLIGGLGVYALLRSRTLVGAACLGIAANGFPVMFYSLRSLRAREKAIGLGNWMRASGRSLIAERYPETPVDTTVIVVATAVPFLALLLAFIDVAIGRSRR
ncbi:MAG TPA: hypothetical protein VFT53_05255 [Candidatus Saccharimonadales bacterium]|nr:hypothetical protein [Candidatus Saccharimonadales bacterium]